MHGKSARQLHRRVRHVRRTRKSRRCRGGEGEGKRTSVRQRDKGTRAGEQPGQTRPAESDGGADARGVVEGNKVATLVQR
jgi:hypothetical protein